LRIIPAGCIYITKGVEMRVLLWSVVVFLLLSTSLCFGQKDRWPPGFDGGESWHSRRLDSGQVAGIIDNLNEEAKTHYGKNFIVKSYLGIGPLNRVQINPDLWKSLSSRQRQELGNKFAKAFRGSGLLFAQFQVGDLTVGKVRSDPVRAGLKYEPAE